VKFVVTILTADNKEHDFFDLEGPIDRAKASALERFRGDGNEQEVVEVLSLPMSDYYDAHQCHDPTGRGCCYYCGGVMPGSILDREINGVD